MSSFAVAFLQRDANVTEIYGGMFETKDILSNVYIL
jgi:hypothetical protein